MALQHLRSSTASKRPDPAAMSDGQLAINTAATTTGLFFKDSGGSLVKVGPVHVGTTAPNATPASGGTAGNSLGEGWLDTSGTNPVLKIYNGTSWVIAQPNASGTLVTTSDTGTVTSTMIADGTIVDADINASAGINFSKLANVTATDKLLGRSSAGAGSIEEISCTAAGRALLDDASASAQRTTLGLAIGVDVQAYDADTAKLDVVQTFTAAQTFNAGASDAGGSFRTIPPNSKTAAYTLLATDTGKYISITTGGVTVPSGVFSAGDVVSIYNNSASDQTITQGASVTLRLVADGTTGNKTLAGYGIATILCVGTNTFVIAGAGVS